MVIDYGKIIFGGVDSSDYGIYISGEGVYNAPERAVELVNVPGRNGAIALDQGRYNNIKVTYPAMVLEADQEHFREKLSEFRNAILSQKGYQRLEDSYHPDEFRMGVYHDGLEVSDILTLACGGNFELTFDCKPQRWLSDGDIPVPINSGDVLQNPTVFDAGPLLEIEGYGTINFNGYEIDLANAVVGNVELMTRKYSSNNVSFSKTYYFDRSLLNEDDVITVGQINWGFGFGTNTFNVNNTAYSLASGATLTPTVTYFTPSGSLGQTLDLEFYTAPFTFGALSESDSVISKSLTYNISGTTGGGSSFSMAVTVYVICGYDYITITINGPASTAFTDRAYLFNTSPVTAVSTLNMLGHPTYIDCDLGEAYRIENGVYRSLNKYVDLGSDLPVLAPGSNTITFDNTITDMKIAPRWWRI